jgi:AraC-like DNA-binding protein
MFALLMIVYTVLHLHFSFWGNEFSLWDIFRSEEAGDRKVLMTTYVRSAVISNFAEVAARYGLDPRGLLREFGLPVQCLDNMELKVPTQAVAKLLEAAAERSAEPAFGLLMAKDQSLAYLGLLGLMLSNAPTLRDAIDLLSTKLSTHANGMSAVIEEMKGSDVVVLRMLLNVPGDAPLRQWVEMTLANVVRIFRFYLGADWCPRAACFSHPVPDNLKVHRAVFSAPVLFSHEFNVLVFRASELDAPNATYDPVRVQFLQRLLLQESLQRTIFTNRIRELVIQTLPLGSCNLALMTQSLGMDRRTVGRKLGAEGTTFSVVLDTVRTELLARYLQEGTHTVTEIASLLGFSVLSSFSRWHMARFGQSARARVARLKVTLDPTVDGSGHREPTAAG